MLVKRRDALRRNQGPRARRTLLPVMFLLFAVRSVLAQELAVEGSKAITVRQAIGLALARNRTIGMSQEDLQHYREMKAKAHAQYLPHISNASNVTFITAREGVVIPPGSFGAPAGTGPIPPRTVRIDQGANDTYASRTTLDQPLTQLFAIHAQNRAAQMDVDRATSGVEQTREDVALQVRQLFYGVLITQKQEQAAQERVSALQEALREARSSEAQGTALQESTLQASTQLAQAQQAALNLQISERDQLFQLRDVIGESLDTPLLLVDTQRLPDPAQALPARGEAVGIALAREPKVQMAQRDVEKAHAAVRLAEDAYIPSVTASAHQSYQSGIALLVRNYGVFEGRLNYDLFDGGTRRANVRDARSALAKAELALAEQRDATRITVEDSYDRLQLSTGAQDIAQQVVKARMEQVRVADAQFQQGEILQSRLDTVHADLADAEVSALQASLEADLARNQIREVLGQIPD